MDNHDAVYGQSNPRSAADFSADDAGVYEHLHATSQYSILFLVRAIAGGASSYPTDLPASLRAVDAASPTTAADLSTDVPTVGGASPTPTAGFPTGGHTVVDRLHEPF